MTILEFMKYYDPNISEDTADFILWEETAFPCCGLRMATYQIRSSIRAGKNKIKRCDLCGWKLPYHQKGCLNI